jgi:hypothetical membrane protein
MMSAAPDRAGDAGTAAAARLAAIGSLAVALIILALHAIKPEYQPSWRFISEYAIGPKGWIMQTAFLLWAASCAALALALRRHVRARRGRAGLVVLLVVVIALVPAGLFPQDPVTASPEEHTLSGTIHAIASMIGVPGIPIAAVLISAGLWRTNAHWTQHRRLLMASAHATWISFAAMAIYLAWAVPQSGGFTPEVAAGWMNRLVVASYLAWQITVASLMITMNPPAAGD